MSAENNPTYIPPEAKQVIHMVLLFTGGILIILAAYMLLDPQAIKALFSINKQTSDIIAFILFWGGIIDIVIAQIIFRRKDTR